MSPRGKPGVEKVLSALTPNDFLLIRGKIFSVPGPRTDVCKGLKILDTFETVW